MCGETHINTSTFLSSWGPWLILLESRRLSIITMTPVLDDASVLCRSRNLPMKALPDSRVSRSPPS